MKVAILIKNVSNDFRGEALLYKIKPPIHYTDLINDKFVKRQTSFIISSATIAFGSPETMVFPACKNGKIKAWCELTGLKGTLDCPGMLDLLGYKIVK